MNEYINIIQKAIQAGTLVRIQRDEMQRTVLAITTTGIVYCRAKQNKQAPVCYQLTQAELEQLARQVSA